MTLYNHIWQIFTSRPNAWLTARRVRTILKNEHGIVECDSFFNRTFRQVQDECMTDDGIKILHFESLGNHYYSLTKNKYAIAKHNARLKRGIRNFNKRMIA